MRAEWSEELKVGVDQMDAQHKTLVDLINSLYDLLEAGKKKEAMDLFRERVKVYLEKHLSDEEKFMESIGYPDLEIHKRAHEKFRKLMLEVCEKLKEEDEREFRSALALLWGWLYSHIQKVDKKYGQFYKIKLGNCHP